MKCPHCGKTLNEVLVEYVETCKALLDKNDKVMPVTEVRVSHSEFAGYRCPNCTEDLTLEEA